MAEEIDKEQLQQSGNNRTAHALYASGSIYEATKVGVATNIQILVRPKPDQLDRLLQPCKSHALQAYIFNSVSVPIIASRDGSPIIANCL